MTFLNDNYLLDNHAAAELYSHVKDLPIIDPHNHGDVKEIVENKGWADIWEVEAATDHYVWELMRKRGVPEKYITGDASNKEKWLALARVFPEFAGNPTYEWLHLDLKRRFGIEELISEETAEIIWNKTSEMLKENKMKPQALLKEMKVEIMCTTDDPTSKLIYHQQAREIEDITILPTWRPDRAMNIEKDGWKNFVKELGQSTNIDTSNFDGFVDALYKTHDYFDEHGCVASDHGILEPVSYHVSDERAKDIFVKACTGQELSVTEVRDFKAYMLILFGKMNEEKNWVTQLHIGAVRDYRRKLFDMLGPDSGGDLSTQSIEIVNNLKDFLNEFDEKLEIVLYCLDPTHLPTLATLSRAFTNVSLGAPWWFNDSPYGMEEHLKYVATVDLLSNHAGMVTDSRKLMSYGSRTEMFRRVLCNVVGQMVNKGQIPFKVAGDLVKNISYYRPLKLYIENNIYLK